MPKAGHTPGRPDFGYRVREIVNPQGNERQQLKSRGITPKNHHHDNLMRLRVLSAISAEMKTPQEHAGSRPASTPTRCEQPSSDRRKHKVCFSDSSDHTSSAASTSIHGSTSINDSDLSLASTPSCSTTSYPLSPGEMRLRGSPGEVHRSSLSNPSSSRPQSAQTPRRNFLENNRYKVHFTPTGVMYTSCRSPRTSGAAEVSYSSNTRPQSASTCVQKKASAPPRKHQPGEVPQYLVARKLELQAVEERKRQAAMAAQTPVGMRFVSEAERVRSLEILRKELSTVMQQYNRLPLNSTTQSHIQHKQALDGRIKQVEQQMTMFERKRESAPVCVPASFHVNAEAATVVQTPPTEAQRIKMLQNGPKISQIF